MTLEEIKKTGDKKAILKYRTQCAKDSVKEYREQMRDATPEEQEAIDKYIKSISKPTGINIFDFYEDEEKSCNNCKHHLKFMCKKWKTCHDYSDWELNELDFVQPKKTIPCTVKIQEQSKTKFWDLDDNDDCISRKAVLSLLADHFDNVFDMVKELPTVAIPSAEPCEDAISRQVVLDYIYNDLGLGDEENGKDVERQMELKSSYKYVKSLPSVKPQEPKTVKSCDTCKHDEAFGCPSFIHDRCENYSEWEQADGEYITQSAGDEIRQKNYDLISRQAVMDCFKKWQPYMATRLWDFEKELSELPSVAIPNKVGHWEYNQYDGNPNIGNWHCSECRNIVSDMPICMGKPLYEFCPNCGCPMEIER